MTATKGRPTGSSKYVTTLETIGRPATLQEIWDTKRQLYPGGSGYMSSTYAGVNRMVKAGHIHREGDFYLLPWMDLPPMDPVPTLAQAHDLHDLTGEIQQLLAVANRLAKLVANLVEEVNAKS